MSTTVPLAGPPGAAAPGVEVRDERHARRTLALSGLAVLVTFLDTTVLFVAFPDISKTFAAAGPAELSWVLNAYTIAFAALLVPAGKIADRIGHKKVFLAGSALFTVASAACALAPTVEVLIAFRVVQAFGAAALIPASLALVLRAFPAERLPFAVAIWGAMGAVAGAIGPTLGATLVQAASWRWVFLINLPAGLVTIVLGSSLLKESSDPETRIPALAGIVSIAGAASLVSLAVVKSDDWGWVDSRTFGAFALGLALFAFFIAHQRRTSAPALDLSLFGIRNYAWANGATFAFGTAFTAMFFGSFLILTQVWDYSVLRAGLGISPGPLVVAVLAPRFGKLAGRIGQRPLLITGGIAFALGGVWRMVAMGAEAHYVADYLPGTLLTGLGVALCLPQLASVTSQALPANRLGVGGAANQAVRQFGGTLGVGLTIAFISQPSSVQAALDNFDRVWLLLVIGGLATSLLSLPLVTRRAPAALPVEDLVLAPELP
ncbi:DHA2 family efflux MFS transporter permease subunit [soil metagenome]